MLNINVLIAGVNAGIKVGAGHARGAGGVCAGSLFDF